MSAAEEIGQPAEKNTVKCPPKLHFGWWPRFKNSVSQAINRFGKSQNHAEQNKSVDLLTENNPDSVEADRQNHKNYWIEKEIHQDVQRGSPRARKQAWVADRSF